MRALLAALAASLLVLSCIIIYAGGFDSPPKFRTFADRTGRIIGTIDKAYDGVRIWTPLERIPTQIIEKTIRSEDRYFFLHRGINPVSIAKAAAENLGQGRVVRGGSTITQQLAKILMQEREGKVPPRTVAAKMKEAALAVGLELLHGKEWILERYLNSAYYGRRAYGVAAAARVRLSKDLSELTNDEVDFLVDLPKAPNRVASTSFSARADVKPGLSAQVGRHFMEYAESQVAPGDARGMVETTLDLALQSRVEEAISAGLRERAREDPLVTAAAVVMDVKSGELLAMAGSRDYFDEAAGGAVNAAVALRQPGSALKPFTYFAAFAKGFLPGSVVPDLPLSFSAAGVEESETYSPQNFDRLFHGEVTMRQALANSYNVPAVVTLNEIGLSFFHDILRRFGFTTFTRPPPHYGLAVTLGSGEVTLVELTNAYAALARGGAYLPFSIEPRAAGDARPVLPNARALSAHVASILSDGQARMKAFGENDSMSVEGHRVAIKTGTSYGHRDNWAIGYSPSFAVGVWVGHADGTPMDAASMTGASSAAPLWHAIMESLLRGRPAEEFPFLKCEALPPAPSKARGEGIPGGRGSFTVTSPVENATYRIHGFMPIEHQGIEARAEAKGGEALRLDWFLDGEYFATTGEAKASLILPPEAGKRRLRVESAEGDFKELSFKVLME